MVYHHTIIDPGSGDSNKGKDSHGCLS
jgi:hypothetical protein